EEVLLTRPPAPRAARPPADPCLVDLDMIPRLATDAVAIGSDHAGAEFVEDLERRLVAAQAELTLELDDRDAWRMARNEVGGPEPDRQRRAGPLHDSAGRQRIALFRLPAKVD